MINLIKIIPELEPDLKKYKVHIATGKKGNNPLIAFFNNKFKEWQEWQSKRNFEREYILSLIYYEPNLWLFAGIYRSISCQYKINHYDYDTELLNIAQEYIGRLIVRFDREFRASYLKLENHYDRIYLSEILKERIMVMKFQGYENVKISFEELKSIINSNEITWKTALENIKGVYLICDRLNGKKYVGSAYGEDAFWSRWAQYASNGHGGNIDLKQILSEKEADYAKNFQFSILEIRAKTTSDDEIIKRESYWKDILMTRQFGYNQN
ncbi:MAG: GIY-YIG nuclease family protein [Bacteroidia bacterium]|nr:GIY-YIG nuclease family protein [Bacteroidia bacterium]